MKLRYSPASPYVRKVTVVAHETGLIDRLEIVPTNVWANDTDIGRDNPLGKVPALVLDDGTVLYDSRVIAEYFDSLAPGAALFPASGPARWTALRRQALGDGIMDAGVSIRYERVVRPAEKLFPDWVEGQRRKILQSLDVLETEARALFGELTIGHVAIGCALGWFDFRFSADNWRQRRPALAAWYATFAEGSSTRSGR